jgi:phytoene synthase
MAIDSGYYKTELLRTNGRNQGTLEHDYAICRQIMHNASKNYSFSSLFLPAERKAHVEALYAVLRVGDDRVDVTHAGFSSALEAIEDWRESYWRAFEHGDSDDPVLRAYLDTADKFDIPADILKPYFRAMRDDLSITRFSTFDDLLYYMDGSAIPVGRAMAHILGTNTAKVSDAYPAADSLSIAMQLSNFWRDIGEDWQRGRVYLPQEDLFRFDYSEEQLAGGIVNENFITLLDFEIARTREYYAEAIKGVGLLSSGRWGVMNALHIYSAILDHIEENEYNVFARRASAPLWRKFWLVSKAGWQARKIQ